MESPDNPEVVPESEEIREQNDSKDEIEQIQQDFQHQTLDEPIDEIWPEYCNPSYIMPEQIEVKVVQGNESYFFPVSVVKANTKKLYLGGYRNKLNGLIYHHANSQTPTDAKKPLKDNSNLRTRETQTISTRTLSVQPYRESGTQMERIDLRIDNKRDVVIYPKPYFTAEQLLIKQKAACIEMQRAWRGYIARCLANQIRQRNLEYTQNEKLARQNELEAAKEQRVKDMARRTHPTTNGDFAVLYNELDTWRKNEIAKIKATTADPEERKLAMAELLSNETKALQSLQKLKSDAAKEIHVDKTQSMLEQMAKPHLWQLSHGEVAQVHTPETQRAKELLDLFNALQAPLLATDQRLDVLLNIKWTVSEFNTPLTNEIKELVDREADLLNRGRPLKSMERLRLRLANMFLQFLENPLYNPRYHDFTHEKTILMK